DTQPLHVATDLYLLLADYRTVVLGLTRNHAGIAAHARVHVDGHAPLISLGVVIQRIERFFRFWILEVLLFVREVRILFKFIVRSYANQIATQRLRALHRAALVLLLPPSIDQREILDDCQFVAVAGLLNLVRLRNPRRLAATDPIGIETAAIANAAGKLTPITQMQVDAVVGHAVDDHPWSFHCAAIHGNSNNVFLVEAFAGRRVETHHRSVIPFQPKYRFRTLLQPSVVVIASVVD